jgi:hypothetical protein
MTGYRAAAPPGSGPPTRRGRPAAERDATQAAGDQASTARVPGPSDETSCSTCGTRLSHIAVDQGLNGFPVVPGSRATATAAAADPAGGPVTGPSYAGVPAAADVRGHIDRAWQGGYVAGWHAGHDVGAARVLIHGPVPALSPGYVDWRARLTADPVCPARCRRCSACVRQAAVTRNRAAYGCDDYPGSRVAA